MTVIATWTGSDAEALRAAYRMTGEQFAETLGVGLSTVRGWRRDPSMVLSHVNQAALDTMFTRAPADVRQRCLELMGRLAEPAAATGHAITVSVAVVQRDSDVLLVRRRGDDKAGLTWQFPAGLVKPGNDKATMAIEETYAETGIHCEVTEHLGGRVHPLTQVYCDYFACDYLGGSLDNRDPVENAGVEWVAKAAVTRFIPPERLYGPVRQRLLEDRAHVRH